jgi:hypothetical protein
LPGSLQLPALAEPPHAPDRRQALNTRDAGIVVVVLKVLQQLVVSGEMIGDRPPLASDPTLLRRFTPDLHLIYT